MYVIVATISTIKGRFISSNKQKVTTANKKTWGLKKLCGTLTLGSFGTMTVGSGEDKEM